jgi:hypothetical protein
MISRYRIEARTAEELKLGWFAPLFEVLPELAALQPVPDGSASPMSDDTEVEDDGEAPSCVGEEGVVARRTVH